MRKRFFLTSRLPSLLTQAFEEFASGLYSREQILKKVTQLGLRTRKTSTSVRKCFRRPSAKWLGKANPEREPASFILFVPKKSGLKVVAQDGTPLPPEHLIWSVNLRVEVRGTEVGDTFLLLGMRKLESPEFPYI